MATRKFKCPYCDYSDTRDILVSHVENKHSEMIPKDYTAARVVFNHINHKDHGTCVVCKRLTEWNENTWKYNRLCGRDSCKKALRKKYQENMIRVYNTDNLLTDPIRQEEMLAHRSISGSYKFKDGGTRTYTGSYEKKTLEFMDLVMNIKSDDIMTPGPIFEYEYKGQKLHWITDILYIPANLVIEVKDGGSNPNTRSMPDYRAKQIAKEKMITSLGTYNYLRLTNNNFAQLLEILAELRMQMIDDTEENKKTLFRINEEVGGIPPSTPFRDSESSSMYIVPYGFNNTFNNTDIEDYGFIRSIDDENMLIADEDNKLKIVNIDSFMENRSYDIYKYTSNDIDYKFASIAGAYNEQREVYPNWLLDTIVGNPILSEDQLLYDSRFSYINTEMYERNSIYKATLENNYKSLEEYMVPLKKEVEYKNNLLGTLAETLDILRDSKGIFLINRDNRIRTESYNSIDSITYNTVLNLIEVSSPSKHNDELDAMMYSLLTGGEDK